VSEIIAPIPDRHLLHSHQSQRWLRSPSHSPASSRTVSPTSQTFRHSTNNRSRRHLSLSTLVENEKPRRFSWSPTIQKDEVKIKPKTTSEWERSMGMRWIRWMHRHGMKQWVVPGAIIASIWVRWAVGMGSYSGKSCGTS
jgi:alpha-1,3-glucosyltransferase